MSRWTANALLLLTALIWGTTFVAQQLGMNHVGPLTYTGVRFWLGALLVLPLALREASALADRGQRPWRRDGLAWCGLGVLLTLGAVLQQIGLLDTSVSNAGFLTALYVPLVPVVLWLWRRERPHWLTWPAALACVAGTWLLSGGKLSALTVGDAWVLASTIFWTLHVVMVGVLVMRSHAPVLMALTQFTVCAVLSTGVAVAMEPWSLPALWAAMPAIAYGGILSVGIAYTLQVVAQRHTGSADAAVLLSSEILFAAMAGALVLGERLSLVQWSGGLLIFASILAVQAGPLLLTPRRAA